MPMTKTEATYVNVLLNWLLDREGNRGVPDDEDARYAAKMLARSASKALGAGINEGVVEDEFDTRRPRVLRGDRLAPEVAELLAGCWTLEEGDGGWPGGDTVEWLCTWFRETCRANITHPVVRAQNGPDGYVPTEGMEEWDEVRDLLPFAELHGRDEYVPTVCERCGGPIRDPENVPVEWPLCLTCAGESVD